jgi:hypothetical protein
MHQSTVECPTVFLLCVLLLKKHSGFSRGTYSHTYTHRHTVVALILRKCGSAPLANYCN